MKKSRNSGIAKSTNRCWRESNLSVYLFPGNRDHQMAIQLIDVIFILIPLIIIFLGCELFTNGIEWLGVKLGLAESCVGSILAAIGTALPETMVPIVAIIFATNGAGHEIAEGAIIGAPFMLATLAMFVGGLTIFVASRRKLRAPSLSISPDHFRADMVNFVLVYSLAVVAALIFSGSGDLERGGRFAIAIALVFFYALYLKKMLSDKSSKCEIPETLYLLRPLKSRSKTPPSLPIVLVQVAAALTLIIGGARLFVSDIEHIASQLNVSEIILAFLIAPVATELPEKFNSVLWYWRGKDTLALGNITGAMVFQASFPVSIGLIFTEWTLDTIHIASMVFALIAMSLLALEMKYVKNITYKTLLISGIFYFVYIVLIIYESSGGSL